MSTCTRRGDDCDDRLDSLDLDPRIAACRSTSYTLTAALLRDPQVPSPAPSASPSVRDRTSPHLLPLDPRPLGLTTLQDGF